MGLHSIELRVLRLAAPRRAPRRTIYFFVSLTVLPTRVWRNSRVTATVTLFSILLDTTCVQPRELFAHRSSLKSHPRTVPITERGMPAALRSCAVCPKRGKHRATQQDGADELQLVPRHLCQPRNGLSAGPAY